MILSSNANKMKSKFNFLHYDNQSKSYNLLSPNINLKEVEVRTNDELIGTSNYLKKINNNIVFTSKLSTNKDFMQGFLNNITKNPKEKIGIFYEKDLKKNLYININPSHDQWCGVNENCDYDGKIKLKLEIIFNPLFTVSAVNNKLFFLSDCPKCLSSQRNNKIYSRTIIECESINYCFNLFSQDLNGDNKALVISNINVNYFNTVFPDDYLCDFFIFLEYDKNNNNTYYIQSVFHYNAYIIDSYKGSNFNFSFTNDFDYSTREDIKKIIFPQIKIELDYSQKSNSYKKKIALFFENTIENIGEISNLFEYPCGIIPNSNNITCEFFNNDTYYYGSDYWPSMRYILIDISKIKEDRFKIIFPIKFNSNLISGLYLVFFGNTNLNNNIDSTLNVFQIFGKNLLKNGNNFTRKENSYLKKEKNSLIYWESNFLKNTLTNINFSENYMLSSFKQINDLKINFNLKNNPSQLINTNEKYGSGFSMVFNFSNKIEAETFFSNKKLFVNFNGENNNCAFYKFSNNIKIFIFCPIEKELPKQISLLNVKIPYNWIKGTKLSQLIFYSFSGNEGRLLFTIPEKSTISKEAIIQFSNAYSFQNEKGLMCQNFTLNEELSCEGNNQICFSLEYKGNFKKNVFNKNFNSFLYKEKLILYGKSKILSNLSPVKFLLSYKSENKSIINKGNYTSCLETLEIIQEDFPLKMQISLIYKNLTIFYSEEKELEFIKTQKKALEIFNLDFEFYSKNAITPLNLEFNLNRNLTLRNKIFFGFNNIRNEKNFLCNSYDKENKINFDFNFQFFNSEERSIIMLTPNYPIFSYNANIFYKIKCDYIFFIGIESIIEINLNFDESSVFKETKDEKIKISDYKEISADLSFSFKRFGYGMPSDLNLIMKFNADKQSIFSKETCIVLSFQISFSNSFNYFKKINCLINNLLVNCKLIGIGRLLIHFPEVDIDKSQINIVISSLIFPLNYPYKRFFWIGIFKNNTKLIDFQKTISFEKTNPPQIASNLNILNIKIKNNSLRAISDISLFISLNSSNIRDNKVIFVRFPFYFNLSEKIISVSMHLMNFNTEVNYVKSFDGNLGDLRIVFNDLNNFNGYDIYEIIFNKVQLPWKGYQCKFFDWKVFFYNEFVENINYQNLIFQYDNLNGCHHSCQTCSDINSSSCLSCEKENFLMISSKNYKECNENKCPDHFSIDKNNNKICYSKFYYFFPFFYLNNNIYFKN